MITTEKFVYIHMPKTGGTFVTSVLFRLHSQSIETFTDSRSIKKHLKSILRGLTRKSDESDSIYGEVLDIEPKHGTCHDIPDEHSWKPILSSIRNPYDWYVSQYEFGWWTRTFDYHPESHPTPVGSAIEKVIPDFQVTHPYFPKISFEEFMSLCSLAASVFNEKYGTDFGLYTHNFIQFYFQNIGKSISILNKFTLNKKLIYLEELKAEMYEKIFFIRTHSANQDLYRFLVSIGYKEQDLDFLPALGKILPMGKGRRDDQTWEKYYSPDLREFIRESDYLIFELFPEFKIDGL